MLLFNYLFFCYDIVNNIKIFYERKIVMKCLDIKLPASDGKDYTLSDFKGEKLILYFYPKDNTSGWIAESKDFTEARLAFEEIGYKIIGVSKDSIKSHLNFIKKQDLELLLLSDEERKLCECFDVLKEKNMFGKKYMGIERSTFVLDEEGKVVNEWRKVKVVGHVEEVLDFVKYKLK